MKNTVNLTKLLFNCSRTLGIAKEVIPIINDYKPLLNSFKNIYGFLTKDDDNKSTTIKEPIKEVSKTIIKEKRTITSNNSPQFFI